MELLTIALGIIIVTIIGLIGFAVYSYLYPSKSITELQNATADINKQVAALVVSIDQLNKTTTGINTDLQTFMKDSRTYYKTNAETSNSINKLIVDVQKTVFTREDLTSLLEVVNARIKEINTAKETGTFRGYFSINDTADQIIQAVAGIQTNFTASTEQYLIQSKIMKNHIDSIIANNQYIQSTFTKQDRHSTDVAELNKRIDDANKRLDDVNSRLDKLISTMDSYLRQMATLKTVGPASTQVAVGVPAAVAVPAQPAIDPIVQKELTALNAQIESLNNEINSIQKQIADVDARIAGKPFPNPSDTALKISLQLMLPNKQNSLNLLIMRRDIILKSIQSKGV